MEKLTYEELEVKVQNLKERITQQNLSLERHKEYKVVLFNVMEDLSESYLNGTREISELVVYIKTTLFGLSKKQGGTRSKATIMRAIDKMRKSIKG
jgi:hypothetical protein